MSFSTQISRGALALALLMLLSLLTLAAKFGQHAQLAAAPASNGIAVCDIASARATTWRFAQTPADLGTLARRADSCRA